MPKSKYPTVIVPLLLLLVTTGAPGRADQIDFAQIDPAEHTYDDWYLDTIEGKAIGYWRSTLRVEEDKVITVYDEYRVESHGGEESTYTYQVVWTETKDFQPISIVITDAAGSEEVTKTYRFVEDGIELTSEQKGRELKRKLPPIKGDYLTAAQTAIATELYLQRGVESFELNTLDIDIGTTPYRMTYTRSKDEPSDIKLADGEETKATRWTTTYSTFPGFEMHHWVDASGTIVGLNYDVDEMTFVSQLADASVTKAEFDPPEMSGLSVVVPDQPIKHVNRQRKIVYEMHYDSGESDIVPITTALQSVQGLGKGKARVTVDLDEKPKLSRDQPDKAYLANSIMIDHEDALVRKLAKQAIANLDADADAKQVAIACKRFVTRHINGASLAVGDGSASEAARTREGDCTECSVLLAALLRVHGIPSRCVSGLVYSEDDFVGQKDVFVYHMWTQAWIETEDGKGYWLDLDSAMWRYSAGHIALGVSAMGDEDQEDLIRIVPLQQNLEIKVVQTIGPKR